jgi:hypothetical protein
MVWRKVLIGALFIVAALSVASCGVVNSVLNPPESVSKGFVRAVFSGDAETALDRSCGTMIVVAVKMDWQDDYYEEVYKDDTSSQVRVKGKLRVTIKDLERFAEPAKQYYGIELPDLQGVQGGFQIGIDFDGMYLSYDENLGEWCIESKTMIAFVEYLGVLFTEELGKLAPVP